MNLRESEQGSYIEYLIPIGLTLIIWNYGRFIGGFVGIGEIIIALVAYYGIINILSNLKNINITNLGQYYSLIAMFYFMVIVLPMSIINSRFTYGVSIFENFAYLLCCSLILTLSMLEINRDRVYKLSVIFILSFVIIGSFLGGEEIWWGDRLSGPSNNPNRLALYFMCVLVMISQSSFKNPFYSFVAVIVTLGIIFMAGSDASFLGFAISGITYLFFKFYRSIYVAPILYLIIFLVSVYSFFYFNEIIFFFEQLWYAASSSSVRVNLLINGFEAWIENPITIFFGHGAGSFSGFSGPFQGWEAHSTIIDMLTISGLFGLALFYFPAAYSIFFFISQNRIFAASAVIGLCTYTLFGFSGRHPIIWLTLFFSMMHANELKIKNGMAEEIKELK